MTSDVMEEGHIYVLGFPDQTLKVGRTTDPEADQRIAVHKKIAGSAPVKVWISEQHGDSNITEQKLIEFCRKFGRVIRGKEWFSGVPYATVQKYAEEMEKHPSRKVCYCGKHLFPAGFTIPRRQDLDGFLRKDLGLTLPPVLEMVFPGDEQFCHAGQMNEVQKLLTRHLTAKADAEFLTLLAMRAWEIVNKVETEIKKGSRHE